MNQDIRSKQFDKRVSALMEYLDYKEIQLGQCAGVSSHHVVEVLEGTCLPSIQFIIGILEHCPKISPKWLVYDDGPMLRTGRRKAPVTGSTTIEDNLKKRLEELRERKTKFVEEFQQYLGEIEIEAQDGLSPKNIEEWLEEHRSQKMVIMEALNSQIDFVEAKIQRRFPT